MSLPTPAATWTISANNRYTYLSTSTVQLVMQNYMLSLKNFLKTTMLYTVNSSCGNSTAGTIGDGIDRWSVATDITPRFNGTTSAIAWFIFTDGNGAQICFSYNSSADDIFRLAYSPGANYALNGGGSNRQPTASDEIVVWSGSATIVNSTTSADRVWHLWGSSDKKMWRSAVYRSGTFTSFWGVEAVSSAVVSPATFSPAMWGFGYSGTSMRISTNAGSLMGDGVTPPGTNSGGGTAYVFSASANRTITVGGGGEQIASVGGKSVNGFGTSMPEFQGRTNQVIVPLTCISVTSNATGKLGTRIDWWAVYSNNPSAVPTDMSILGTGGTSNQAKFVTIGCSMHPWDGSTVPQIA